MDTMTNVLSMVDRRDQDRDGKLRKQLLKIDSYAFRAWALGAPVAQVIAQSHREVTLTQTITLSIGGRTVSGPCPNCGAATLLPYMGVIKCDSCGVMVAENWRKRNG